tara:strand:- start:215 stop:559 length:345 start_codon:yes stop_codon:yes gene_type:complete
MIKPVILLFIGALMWMVSVFFPYSKKINLEAEEGVKETSKLKAIGSILTNGGGFLVYVAAVWGYYIGMQISFSLPTLFSDTFWVWCVLAWIFYFLGKRCFLSVLALIRISKKKK